MTIWFIKHQVKPKIYCYVNRFCTSYYTDSRCITGFLSGVIQCNIYVPRGKGSATLSELGEAVIDGLTSVNASDYTDTFSCDPRVLDVVGPAPIELDDSAHFFRLNILPIHCKCVV